MTCGGTCRSCGGALDAYGPICPYCGTPRPDILAVMQGRPVKLSYVAEGVEYTFCINVRNVELCQYDDRLLYCDPDPYVTLHTQNRLTIEADMCTMEYGDRDDILIVKRVL